MLNNYIERYRHSAFARNVMTALTGTATAQIIQVIGAPLLAYLFSPETFGVFSLYVATTALFSVVSTLRYEMAVTLVEHTHEARLLVKICAAIAVGVALIAAGFVGALAALWPEQRALAQLGVFVWLVPVSVLLTGVFQSFYYYALRDQRFRLITSIKIMQAVAFVVLPMIFWFAGLRENGLVWGYVLHQFLALIAIGALVLPSIYSEPAKLSVANAKPLLLRYRNLPGVNALHAFTDSAQQALLNYFIATWYGSAMLGFYALAYRALRAPAAVVSAALSQVLFQRMADNYNKRVPNKPTFRAVTMRLAVVSLPVFALVVALAPWIFETIMGEEWWSAGKMVQCLSPWIAVAFISSPMSHLPNITFRQVPFLLFTVLINAVAFGAMFLTFVTGSTVFRALLAYSTWWGVGCLLLLFWFYKLAGLTKHDHRAPAG